MRFVTPILLSFFVSSFALADLQDGDRARYDLKPVPVYKVLSARVTLNNLNVRLLVEGNICGNERSSLASFEKWEEGNRTDVTFFTRGRKPLGPVQCAEYSKETRIVSRFLFDSEGSESKVFDFDGNTVTLRKVNGRWVATISNPERE